MSGIGRAVTTAKTLGIAQLGTCSRGSPFTACLGRSGASSSRSTLQALETPLPSQRKCQTINVHHSISITGRSGSLMPAVQALRCLYRVADSRKLSSSSAAAAKGDEAHNLPRSFHKAPQKAATKKVQARPHTPPKPPPGLNPQQNRSNTHQTKVDDQQMVLEARAAAFRNGELPHQWLLWVIAGINVAVFGLWQYAQHTVDRYKDPTTFLTMYNNFTCSFRNLYAGRYWTILTSCFSHQAYDHFLFNIISFMFMAPPVLTLLGPAGFSLLYIGAGVGASVFSLSWRKYINPWIYGNNWTEQQRRFDLVRSCHGASGSIFGVVTTFALIDPRRIFLLFFVVPVPAWVCVPGLFAWDLYSAWREPNGAIDSSSHLGGAICGLLFWRFRMRGIRIR